MERGGRGGRGGGGPCRRRGGRPAAPAHPPPPSRSPAPRTPDVTTARRRAHAEKSRRKEAACNLLSISARLNLRPRTTISTPFRCNAREVARREGAGPLRCAAVHLISFVHVRAGVRSAHEQRAQAAQARGRRLKLIVVQNVGDCAAERFPSCPPHTLSVRTASAKNSHRKEMERHRSDLYFHPCSRRLVQAVARSGCRRAAGSSNKRGHICSAGARIHFCMRDQLSGQPGQPRCGCTAVLRKQNEGLRPGCWTSLLFGPGTSCPW